MITDDEVSLIRQIEECRAVIVQQNALITWLIHERNRLQKIIKDNGVTGNEHQTAIS